MCLQRENRMKKKNFDFESLKVFLCSKKWHNKEMKETKSISMFTLPFVIVKVVYIQNTLKYREKKIKTPGSSKDKDP